MHPDRQIFAEITAFRIRMFMNACGSERDFREIHFGIQLGGANSLSNITLAVNKASARKGNPVNKGDLISTCDSVDHECLLKIISLRPLSIVLIEAPPAIRPDKFRCNIAGG